MGHILVPLDRAGGMRRRALLAAVGVLWTPGVAGCSRIGDEEPPAGTLRFANDHHLPHVIRFAVVGVGAEPAESGRDADDALVTGDVTVRPDQRELRASSSVAPGETQTFPGVFAEPVWYGVAFAVDGRTPEAGRLPFHPAPPGRDRGRVLSGRVYPNGEFSWVISTTENPGTFAVDGSN